MLGSNVWVDGAWFGPSYPAAGDPPLGKVGPHLGGTLIPSYSAHPAGARVEADASPEQAEIEALRERVAQLTRYVLDPDGAEPPDLDELDPDDPSRPSGPPPKGGKGSGEQAWRSYAAARGVVVQADASREDVIAACEAADVPTE